PPGLIRWLRADREQDRRRRHDRAPPSVDGASAAGGANAGPQRFPQACLRPEDDHSGPPPPLMAGIVKRMSEPIDLKATFIPNEGEFFRVKLALEIAIEEVVNEPGCIRYELTEATEEKLVLTERWASEDLLDKHSKGI